METSTTARPTDSPAVTSMRLISQELREAFARKVVEQVAAGAWSAGPAALGLDLVGLNGSVVDLQTAAIMHEDLASSTTYAACITRLAQPSPVDDPERCPAADQCGHGGSEYLCSECWDCHDCVGAACTESLERDAAELRGDMVRDGGCSTATVLVFLAVAVAILLAGAAMPTLPGLFAVLLLGAGAGWFVCRLREAQRRFNADLEELGRRAGEQP